jgi:hypothetical protein
MFGVKGRRKLNFKGLNFYIAFTRNMTVKKHKENNIFIDKNNSLI